MAEVDMTSVWTTLADLATAWRAAPLVAEMNRLAPLPLHSTTPTSQVLQEMDAGGASITGRPLSLRSEVQTALRLSPQERWDVTTEEFTRLLQIAERTESAHHYLVRWVRARLPRYPMLNVPQLARNSALTTDEFTWRIPWLRADFGAQLQYQSSPQHLAPLLGLSDSRPLASATKGLVVALERSEAWQVFADTASALTSADIDDLRVARADLERRLSPEAVDRFEPHRALRRLEFRQHHTIDVVESLDGAAGKYATAFTQVDELIELVVADVLAQLVRAGRPTVVAPKHVEFTHGGRRTAMDLTDSESIWLKPGQLISPSHPLITEVVRIESSTFAIDAGRSRMHVEGPLLEASEALRDFALSPSRD